MKSENTKLTVRYPRFSSYFGQLLDCREMRSIDVARICNIDETVVFKWRSGRHLPKKWDSLEPVIVKLRFTSSEISGLHEIYQAELLGEEQSQCFHEIIEIFHVLEDKQAEYGEEQQIAPNINIEESSEKQGLEQKEHVFWGGAAPI